jgi:DNA segregation ATPase FtsK/SpoIIIE, S-DNA-T family
MEFTLKQAASTKPERAVIAHKMAHRLREGLFILAIALAIFLFISFVSYHTTDPAWSSSSDESILNWGGRVGAFLSDIFLSLFGLIAYLFLPLLVLAAWLGIKLRSEETKFGLGDFSFKTIGFLLVMLSGCGLTAVYFKSNSSLPAHTGGIIGDIFANTLTHSFNHNGSVLFLVTIFLCGFTLFSGLSWLGLMDFIGKQAIRLLEPLHHVKIKLWESFKQKRAQAATGTPAKPLRASVIKPPLEKREPRLEIKNVEPVPKVKSIPKKVENGIVLTPGMLPPLTLLSPPPPIEGKAFSNITFEDLSQLVETRLMDFGVQVKVVAVLPGPVITRLELELAPGIKVSKISGLAKDIARSLSVISVRVVEVIPGKSVIGLEIPNEYREAVFLRDVLESQRYQQAKSPVSLALGKDIAGHPVIVDLAKMPHLLVAGTTGSGKSVSINAMILSMLLKSTPEQLRLILIDPKMLELSVYEGVPHLLTPVITDMKDAANALRWCVSEMDKRYRLMASLGVRNIAGYNQKVIDATKQGNPIPAPPWLMVEGSQPQQLEPLPTIVVVADEFADMMISVGRKVEDLVTRIAQKARAAGLHLILATQRPSVDVITGLIKANIPTRIAFQVSSRIDSRTILDQQGAEQLLGNGDMLYLPPGTGLPVRVHGAYVGDDDVHRVVAAWQSYGKPVYLDEVVEGDAEATGQREGEGELDPLYDEALRIVTESRRASISLVQRRLKIGYNRAARIMEEMEAAGVVSIMDGNGYREVLAPPPVEI